MSTFSLVVTRTALSADGFELVQTEYECTPPFNGFFSVVVSHVDPAARVDPTGVFWGETLDGAANQPSYEAYEAYTANREWFRDVMTDSEALGVTL